MSDFLMLSYTSVYSGGTYTFTSLELNCSAIFTNFFKKLHQGNKSTNETQNKIIEEFESLKK